MKYCNSSWQHYVLTMLKRSGSNNRCIMGDMITVWEGRGGGGRERSSGGRGRSRRSRRREEETKMKENLNAPQYTILKVS